MSGVDKRKSGGGAATTAGTTFQEDVACYLSTLILAEEGAEPPTGLPQGVNLCSIVAETTQPIDDILVETSVGGVLYFQVKTSLPLSDDPGSEFAKVCEQFVRQRLLGARPFGGPSRSLNADRDRFILAVGHGAPATITGSLAEVLAKCRHLSDEDGLAGLSASLNSEEKKALATTRANIERNWIAINGVAPSALDLLSVLHLMHVLQLDLRPDGNAFARAKDLLRQAVLRNANRSGDAWNALVAICRTFSPKRTGGDLAFFRAELLRREIPIRSVASFDDDIESLRKYTANRLTFLHRLSVMEMGGEPIKITREVVAALIDFAALNHTAVIGEPGAGKSGCIHDFAERLRHANADVVLIAADMVKASSPEALAADLSLSKSRSLVDVLQNWSGEGVGFLVVDALDAARSGMSLHVLCEILRDVRVRAPRWHIVASIREYDFRTNPEVQDLFAGKPHTQFQDSRFPAVRHVRIDRLTALEVTQVTSAHASIAAALAAAPALADLVRNPFNLSLLCKLLQNNVSSTELNVIQTQVGLLDLYWNRRVEAVDRIGRLIVLEGAVNLMVAVRELHVPYRSLAQSVPANTVSFDALLSDGVLVELTPKPKAAAIVGFAHNILFDYAVCRIWLDGLSDDVITKLSQPNNHDLLLAIRPSIAMAFEELWSFDESRTVFWQRAAAFEQAPGMRLIGKIIAAGVAAQQYRKVSDAKPLIDALLNRNASSAALLRFTIQAAITQQDSVPAQRPLIGEGAAEWMELAAVLCQYLDQVAWEVRSLLWNMKREQSAATEEQRRSANSAALALLRFGLSVSRFHNVVRTGLEVAANTISFAPESTANALSEVLRDENMAVGAHEWLRPLAERLHLIAQANPELALQIVDAVFEATGDREAAVPMGGRIFSLSMNKHDLIRMAQHAVQKEFGQIWERDPVTATRIVLKVMKATIEKDHAGLAEQDSVDRIRFRGSDATLQADASHIWTAGKHNQHEEWHQILSAFQEGLKTLARREQSEVSLGQVLDVLRDEARFAVVWTALIKAAAEQPDRLGTAVSELLKSAELLMRIDTRKAAGDLIASSFAFLPLKDRSDIEAAIIRIPEVTPAELHEDAEHRRDRILGCIPVHLIQSPELTKLRVELDAAGGPPANEPEFSISTNWEADDEDWWLRRQGVNVDKTENIQLREFAKSVKSVQESSASKRFSAEEADAYLALLQQAESAVEASRKTDADPDLIDQLEDELIAACSRLTATEGFRRDSLFAKFVRSTLRRGATIDRPKHNAENDKSWDGDLASWGSPSARIDAAMGLMRLAANSEAVDAEVLADIARLADDPAPAVRFQIQSHCGWLYRTAPMLMWSLIDKTCESEQRPAILKHFAADVLLGLPVREYEQVESNVRRLYRRCRRNQALYVVRPECATFYTRAALWQRNQRANRYLRVFADRPVAFAVESNTVIGHCRELIRFGSADDPDENKRVRQWAFAYLTHFVRVALNCASHLRDKHANSSLDLWPSDDVGKLRQLHQLVHNIAIGVYFGSGASEERNGPSRESDEASVSDEAKARLLSEGNALFDALCNVEFVESAYDVLQTLEFLIGADSTAILLRIATLVRKAERDGIQYESMAADLVVRIVERYLSEYGNLFRENSEARLALLDILDVFVGAGWPDATRLTYRLGEVFR